MYNKKELAELLRQLKNYDTCHDGCVDDAATFIEYIVDNYEYIRFIRKMDDV